MSSPNYRGTIAASYCGNIAMSIVINITPVLFIPLKDQFGLTYQHLGLLVLINFLTQVSCDIAFSKAVDRYGFRPFIVGSHILCGIGFLVFASTPWLFASNPLVGLIAGTILFSAASGLFELLLSPIVDALPNEHQGKSMAMLHSVYAWGQVGVVLITTAFIAIFGRTSWPYIVMVWSILPFANAIAFAKVPLAQKHAPGSTAIMTIRKLLRSPVFIVAFFAILFGGASEVIMNQWVSSFLERGIVLPKLSGDLFGMAGFAVMLGLGRLAYGIWGDKLDINRVMIYGSAGAVVCYLVAVFAPHPAVNVLACAICGICVSFLWPCTLVVASAKLPLAGASMFALLSAGGDSGAALGPWITGIVTDTAQRLQISNLFGLFTNLTPEQIALRAGLLVGVVMPLCACICQILLRKVQSKEPA